MQFTTVKYDNPTYVYPVIKAQLKEEYEKMGYTVSLNEPVNQHIADLLATKVDENIIVQLRMRNMTSEQKQTLSDLHLYVQNRKNWQMRVVFVRISKEKEIEIPQIHEILLLYFTENLPSELDELASHTYIEDISDIEIEQITVADNGEMRVKGNAIVEVDLQMGSNGDIDRGDGWEKSDSFPFFFTMNLSYNKQGHLVLGEEIDIKIETDTYYQ